jgi:molybdenum cofactor cytidylyltransferase
LNYGGVALSKLVGRRQSVFVSGLVLASGTSSRFCGKSKLLSILRGQAVLLRTVNAYVEALGEVWVVVAPQPNPAVELITLPGVHLIENPDFSEGQSAALRHGIESLPRASAGAVIGVGDQPLLDSTVITRLVEAWSASSAPIVAPRFGGYRGNPVVFDRALFGVLARVTGDVGGRLVLQNNPHEFVDFEEASYGIDIDSPDDLARAQVALDRLRARLDRA